MKLPQMCRSVVFSSLGLALLLIQSASAGQIVFDGFSMTANGTSKLDGSNLQLTQSVNDGNVETGSAFITNPYTLTTTSNFQATFSFSMQNNGTQNTDEFFPFQGNGGGFSFIVQNIGGPTFMTGNLNSNGYDGYSNSLGVDFNANQPNALAPSPTAGVVTVIPPDSSYGASPTQNFDLQGNTLSAPNLVTGTINIGYDATLHLLTVTGSNSTGDTLNLSDSINLYNIITEGNPAAPPTAFFGFEGQEGGGFSGLSQTEITSFSLSVGPASSVPEPSSLILMLMGGMSSITAGIRRHMKRRLAWN